MCALMLRVLGIVPILATAMSYLVLDDIKITVTVLNTVITVYTSHLINISYLS